MSRVSAVVALLVFALAAWPTGAQAARGKVTGGEVYALPEWFKASFLDFRDDLVEAKKQDKHLMAFLHLDECPYCAKMLKENFRSGERREYIERHFDVIGINIRGDAELTWVDGSSSSEKALARKLGVFATPTIVFFDLDGNKVLQLNGYRDPRAFGQVLEYVHARRYRSETLAAYLAANKDGPALYVLREHPQFSARTDLKGHRRPLAVLFEDRQCAECARFHERVLHHPEVLPEMAKYLFVRLDTDASEAIVDPDGKTTTAGQWAKDLGLSYRPAVVLFDEGREIMRIDGRLYHFHFREMLRYVSGGHYKRFESMSQYNAARREELLRQGIDIDFAE